MSIDSEDFDPSTYADLIYTALQVHTQTPVKRSEESELVPPALVVSCDEVSVENREHGSPGQGPTSGAEITARVEVVAHSERNQTSPGFVSEHVNAVNLTCRDLTTGTDRWQIESIAREDYRGDVEAPSRSYTIGVRAQRIHQ